MSTTKTYRAEWALPISSPPISPAEVIVDGDKIVEIRQAGKSSSDVIDLGNSAVIPGFVNVHTHLDYTVLRGMLEDLEFLPWIREITMRMGALDPDDWAASALWGAAEGMAAGVTTIGDCSPTGAALEGAHIMGMGGIVYQEVFGIDESRAVSEIVGDLTAKVTQFQKRAAGSRLNIGISPHAPYTVRAELFRALAAYAKAYNLPVCIHAAESQSEAELIRQGTGPMAEMFERREISWSPPGGSTVGYLNDLGILGKHTLLVHGVQGTVADQRIMAETGAAWAHCPKSNAKLANGCAPFELLQSDGTDGNSVSQSSIRVGLGSDSVASNNSMDMFEEMRFAVLLQRATSRSLHGLTAEKALRMATLGGAEALSLQNHIGSLESGKFADLCVVSLDGLHSAPVHDPVSALVYAGRASDVITTMTSGHFRYDARQSTHLDEKFPDLKISPLHIRFLEAARKMREWRPANL